MSSDGVVSQAVHARKDFFISYTHADERWAEWIAWELEAAGYSTIIQKWDFRPAHNFVELMDDAIRQSERLIAVFSAAYLRSAFGRSEWTAALAANRERPGTLLPARVEGIELDGLMRPIIYIDLVDKSETAAREALLSGVQSGRGKPAVRPAFPGHATSQRPPFPAASPRPEGVIGTLDPSSHLFADAHRASLNIGGAPDPVTKADADQLDKLRALIQLNWIDGYLTSMLSGSPILALGKEAVQDAVSLSFRVLSMPARRDIELPPGTRTLDAYDKVGCALLILGAPGAGKTVALLELAKSLLDRSVDHTGIAAPIPVVLPLEEWSSNQRPMKEWIEEQLIKCYRVGRRTARSLIDERRLVYMLDGLDEVKQELQATCVSAINAFVDQTAISGLVVTCREEEYRALPTHKRLNLNGAIRLQPLTPEQIDALLIARGRQFEGLRHMLSRDVELLEEARSPFILGLMCQVYADVPVQADSPHDVSPVERENIVEAYVMKALEEDSEAQVINRFTRLTWIARGLQVHFSSAFSLEYLQPSWLRSKMEVLVYTIVTRALRGTVLGIAFWLSLGALNVSIIGGLLVGIVAGIWHFHVLSSRILPAEANDDEPDGSLLWALLACFGMFMSLTSLTIGVSVRSFLYSIVLTLGWLGEFWPPSCLCRDIVPVEVRSWSWRQAGRTMLWMTPILAVSMAIFWWVDDPTSSNATRGPEMSFVVGEWFVQNPFARIAIISVVLSVGFSAALAWETRGIDQGTRPNLPILRSVRRAMIAFSCGAAGFVFLIGLVGIAIGGVFVVSVLTVALGLALGIMLTLHYGAGEALKHYVLRSLIATTARKSSPLRMARALAREASAEVKVLRRVGGQFMFVHRLLQDYFVYSDTAQAVMVNRRILPGELVLDRLDQLLQVHEESDPEPMSD